MDEEISLPTELGSVNINETFDDEIKKDTDSDRYTYLSELKSIRDRKDRSTLKIRSVYPERFLSKDIAHPDELKHLTIILDFNHCSGSYTYYTWYARGSDDLCSDIVNFHYLETLTATDLNILEDLWIEFANNSKNLKEIYFSSSCEIDYADSFYFDEKEKAVEAIFKIPTLEKVTINRLYFPYFPPGPSNIKHLELCTNNEETTDAFKTYDNKYFEQIKSYSYNFCTHINLKTLILDTLNISPFKLKDLKLEQMIQLEEIEIKSYWEIDEIDIESILMLPNLKKFSCRINETDSLMTALMKTLKLDFDLKFPSVEEVTIYVLLSGRAPACNNNNINEMKNYLSTVLEKRCLNFKKLLFKVL